MDSIQLKYLRRRVKGTLRVSPKEVSQVRRSKTNQCLKDHNISLRTHQLLNCLPTRTFDKGLSSGAARIFYWRGKIGRGLGRSPRTFS